MEFIVHDMFSECFLFIRKHAKHTHTVRGFEVLTVQQQTKNLPNYVYKKENNEKHTRDNAMDKYTATGKK